MGAGFRPVAGGDGAEHAAGLPAGVGRPVRVLGEEAAGYLERGCAGVGGGPGRPGAGSRGCCGGCSGRGGGADGQELGLSPATIAQWLSAVSSFYRFVSTRYLVRTADGGERPLHAYNPAANVRRPEVEAYTESEFLDARALARLLGAIPRDTVAGCGIMRCSWAMC